MMYPFDDWGLLWVLERFFWHKYCFSFLLHPLHQSSKSFLYWKSLPSLESSHLLFYFFFIIPFFLREFKNGFNTIDWIPSSINSGLYCFQATFNLKGNFILFKIFLLYLFLCPSSFYPLSLYLNLSTYHIIFHFFFHRKISCILLRIQTQQMLYKVCFFFLY